MKDTNFKSALRIINASGENFMLRRGTLVGKAEEVQVTSGAPDEVGAKARPSSATGAQTGTATGTQTGTATGTQIGTLTGAQAGTHAVLAHVRSVVDGLPG